MSTSQNIIRLPATIKKTGLSRSAIYAQIQLGLFPKQVKLSARAIGFIESEIDQWLTDKVNART